MKVGDIFKNILQLLNKINFRICDVEVLYNYLLYVNTAYHTNYFMLEYLIVKFNINIYCCTFYFRNNCNIFVRIS